MSKVDRLKNIIAEITGADSTAIAEHTTLEQLGIDALDAVDLVMTVEAEFDVLIPHNAKITNIDDFIPYLA